MILQARPGQWSGASKFLLYQTLATTLLGCCLPLLPPRSMLSAELCLWSLLCPSAHLPGQPLSHQAHPPHLPALGCSYHIQTVLPSLSLNLACASQRGQLHCPSEPQQPSLPRNLPKHCPTAPAHAGRPLLQGTKREGTVFTPLGGLQGQMIE